MILNKCRFVAKIYGILKQTYRLHQVECSLFVLPQLPLKFVGAPLRHQTHIFCRYSYHPLLLTREFDFNSLFIFKVQKYEMPPTIPPVQPANQASVIVPPMIASPTPLGSPLAPNISASMMSPFGTNSLLTILKIQHFS